MPYTEKQRKLFHAKAAQGEPGMTKLAKEADSYARAGKEKPPVHARGSTTKRPSKTKDLRHNSKYGGK